MSIFAFLNCVRLADRKYKIMVVNTQFLLWHQTTAFGYFLITSNNNNNLLFHNYSYFQVNLIIIVDQKPFTSFSEFHSWFRLLISFHHVDIHLFISLFRYWYRLVNNYLSPNDLVRECWMSQVLITHYLHKTIST